MESFTLEANNFIFDYWNIIDIFPNFILGFNFVALSLILGFVTCLINGNNEIKNKFILLFSISNLFGIYIIYYLPISQYYYEYIYCNFVKC